MLKMQLDVEESTPASDMTIKVGSIYWDKFAQGPIQI